MIITIDQINKFIFSLITIKIFHQHYYKSNTDLKDLLSARFLKYILVLLPFYSIAIITNTKLSNPFGGVNLLQIQIRIWQSIFFFFKALLTLIVYIYILSNIPNYIQYKD